LSIAPCTISIEEADKTLDILRPLIVALKLYVSSHTIEQIAEVMKKMGSKKGLLITASKLKEEIKELACQKSVIVIEGVTSEQDIISGLRSTKIFS